MYTEKEFKGLTAALAKRDFEYGFLSGFAIDKSLGGWILLINQRGTNRALPLLDARKNEARVFKTLNGAVHTAKSIGFNISRLINA